MTSGGFRFDRFCLDPSDRQLSRDDVRVDLNARYFDALALLVREGGRLVSKDRFLDEVWRGVPVTDEALTQCIKTLRRQLGDDASRPRFIETVPKHGYRFIAPVETIGTRFGGIPRSLPMPALPALDFAAMQAVLPDAIAFTLLGAIESLLSAVVADGMTGRRHRSNCELVAQGFANIG